ncbi:hypothetical protein J3R30DRAFT_3883328 [Lentinula aciculospora]|uniref:DUF6987 domain-containing protein n=1 Tax=Lentinula aciculospora TaxID=153920 RepID=A0A9W9DNL7_9AGAR|nr:hypothetical protein J3R30DRAFT_3883328 [Lentinula aciculospora]
MSHLHQDPATSRAGEGLENAPPPSTTNDDRTDEERKKEGNIAERLSRLIEDANSRVVPLTKMIRKHIENMEAHPDNERNEDKLVQQVRPLLQQAEKIMNECQGMVKGADPDNKISNKAKRHQQAHTATPEEQRLAEALKVMIEEVGGTIEWARDKLDSFPKAKRDLVAGVGMLLAAVSNLVNNLLSGLGLNSLLTGILGATGLDKIFIGLGFGHLFPNANKKK